MENPIDETQLIKDTGDLRRWRTELPNLYDDADLDVHEFRLLAHYKRIGNRCIEGVRTTAKKCHMSVGAVVEKRRSLAAKGFITLFTHEDTGKVIVEVVDMWEQNFLTYSQLSTKKMIRLAAGSGAKKISPKPSRDVAQRPQTLRHAVVDRLEKFFIAQTNIPAPRRGTEGEKKAGGKRWWNPLWRIYNDIASCDADRAEAIIQAAIMHMRAEHLDVTAPASVEGICGWLSAQVAGGSNDGDNTEGSADDMAIAEAIAERMADRTGASGNGRR